jgi:hypothetical protein
MKFREYLTDFEAIINTPDENQKAPYDNPDYIDYTKLNWARMNRWLKTGKLSDELKKTVRQIKSPQKWIVITEPWCGDAAHSVPFIELASRENPLIEVSYELRDSEPFRIEQYLTNGTKSIPKLIVRDGEGKDLGVWGPRPKACQELYRELTAQKADFHTAKNALQKWYNTNKGRDIQEELTFLLERT